MRVSPISKLALFPHIFLGDVIPSGIRYFTVYYCYLSVVSVVEFETEENEFR